jgi:hypothetical protein
MEPPPDRDQLPLAQRAEPRGRAAPPLASSAASRRLHSPPALGWEREPLRYPRRCLGRRGARRVATSPPIPRSASQPRGSASRVAAHRSGAFAQHDLSAPYAAPAPPRGSPRIAAGTRPAPSNPPLFLAQGPRSSPRPAPETPFPSRSPWLAARLTAPSRLQDPRSLQRPPRRRRAQGSRTASSAPPLGGSRFLQREGGRVGTRGKKRKVLGTGLGSPPSSAARWRAPRC